MRNLWIHADNPFVMWRADFTAVQRKPQPILDVVKTIVAAGARHEVYTVIEAPLIGFQRSNDGDLGVVLQRLLDEQRVLDLFGFTGSAALPTVPSSSHVQTRMSLYDREDRIVEKLVSDQGAELKATEPVEDVIPNGFMVHCPAVRILGRRYEDVREGEPLERRREYQIGVSVRIELHSDIWFPWVYGSAHPDADHKRMFDNHELAALNTPRLNAFLAEAAAATRAIGATFAIDPDDTGYRARDWVTDDSVLLDWKPMMGVFPESALDSEWY